MLAFIYIEREQMVLVFILNCDIIIIYIANFHMGSLKQKEKQLDSHNEMYALIIYESLQNNTNPSLSFSSFIY